MRTVLIEAAGEEQLVHHGAHAVYGHKDSLLVWDVEPLQHHGARVGRTWPGRVTVVTPRDDRGPPPRQRFLAMHAQF